MNRRSFLQNSSLAVVAAAGLPRAIRHWQSDLEVYKTQLDNNAAGQWYYELTLDPAVLAAFDNTLASQRVLSLKVAYFATTDFTKPIRSGEYRFIVTGSSLTDASSSLYELTTKLDKKVSGTHKFSSEFPKNLKFHVTEYLSAAILNKKGEPAANLVYPTSSSSTNGCFLTTACVQQQNLADDCYELQTLRSLRDQHMNKTEQGRTLIRHYQIMGPALVAAINHCVNKEHIYDYMYRQMIRPCVELIVAGRQQEAVEHYTIFVAALRSRYLLS